MNYPPPLGKLKWIATMAILLQLVACKNKKFLEPQSTSHNLLPELQQWYSKNPATWKNFTKSKNLRTNEPDTSLFYPQWYQTSTLVDNNGNYVFIIPIYREFLVAYTDDYDVVRRLRIVTNEYGEVIQVSIMEIITERNSLAVIEKNILRNLNHLEVSNFSGIILEYDMSYQLQRSRFWLNGNLVKQGIEVSLEQEIANNSQRSNDCFPAYMYVRIPGDCPNTGQPGHTGQLCLVQDTWVRVLVGYDCFLHSVAPNPINVGGGGTNITDPFQGFLSGCCGSLGGDTGSNIGGPRGGYYFIDPNYLPPNFDDPSGIYRSYKKALKDDLEVTNSFIQNYITTPIPDLQKIVSYKRIRLEALKKAIADIVIIEKSTRQYKFITLPPENGRPSGETYYDVGNNKIVIAFPQSTNGKDKLGLKAHEVHHGAQFETGKLSFSIRLLEKQGYCMICKMK